jgi:hypothetical protein
MKRATKSKRHSTGAAKRRSLDGNVLRFTLYAASPKGVTATGKMGGKEVQRLHGLVGTGLIVASFDAIATAEAGVFDVTLEMRPTELQCAVAQNSQF